MTIKFGQPDTAGQAVREAALARQEWETCQSSSTPPYCAFCNQPILTPTWVKSIFKTGGFAHFVCLFQARDVLRRCGFTPRQLWKDVRSDELRWLAEQRKA